MTDNTGLSDWEYGSRENMIKGRIAETLIEELFLALDYNVFRYGMENTIPGIKESLRGMRSNVANSIRKMPDLVVQNGNCIYFIEVKYCGDGTFNYKRLIKESNYPYDDAYIIVVSKKHIKCISVKELMNGGYISPSSKKNYLGNREEFKDLNKEKITDFCKIATKLFVSF